MDRSILSPFTNLQGFNKCFFLPWFFVSFFVGVTIIGHNYDDEAVSVSGYEPPGSFQLQLRYNNANFEQLEALTKVSQTCEQYIKVLGQSFLSLYNRC